MRGDRIRYKTGYRYQLVTDYHVQLSHVRPEIDIITEYIDLDRTGVLTIRHMYAWDGPSNPIYRFLPRFILYLMLKRFMRGSLVHDVLAQLMRDGYLNSGYFTNINKELKTICIEDGMRRIRAAAVFIGVEYLGGKKWTQWGDGGKHLREAP